MVLEVGEAGFGGDLGVADTAGLCDVNPRSTVEEGKRRTHTTPGNLIRLAVIVLVIRRLPIAAHSHDIGKDGAGPVVLVRIEEDAETLEVVCGTEDRSGGSALLGEPHGHAVAVEVALAVDLELDQNLVSREHMEWCVVRRRDSVCTSQFVAVSGTRENIQPSREGLSEASRMYLSVRMMVSPPKSHQRLCMSESRYGYARLEPLSANYVQGKL